MCCKLVIVAVDRVLRGFCVYFEIRHARLNIFVQDWNIGRRAKKVLSDSPGLVDFAIVLVNYVFNLPDGQVMFYEEFE